MGRAKTLAYNRAAVAATANDCKGAICGKGGLVNGKGYAASKAWQTPMSKGRFMDWGGTQMIYTTKQGQNCTISADISSKTTN